MNKGAGAGDRSEIIPLALTPYLMLILCCKQTVYLPDR